MVKSKKIKTWALVLVFIALFLVLADFVTDFVLKKVVCRSLERETGLQIELDKLDYSLLNSSFELRGMRIMNTEEYGETAAVVLNRVYIEAGLSNLMDSNATRMRRCEIDIAVLNLIGAPGGNSNLDKIVARIEERDDESDADVEEQIADQSELEPGQPETDAASRSSSMGMKEEDEFWIGALKIKLDNVTLKTDSKGEAKSYRIGQTLEFENVVDLDEVGTQLAISIFTGAGPELLDDMGDLLK